MQGPSETQHDRMPASVWPVLFNLVFLLILMAVCWCLAYNPGLTSWREPVLVICFMVLFFVVGYSIDRDVLRLAWCFAIDASLGLAILAVTAQTLSYTGHNRFVFLSLFGFLGTLSCVGLCFRWGPLALGTILGALIGLSPLTETTILKYSLDYKIAWVFLGVTIGGVVEVVRNNRLRFRFSLRTLFLVTTIVAGLFGLGRTPEFGVFYILGALVVAIVAVLISVPYQPVRNEESSASQSEDTSVASTMKTLGIDQLSVEERLALVHEIWDSIVPESGHTQFSDTQRDELQRRVADHEKNPEDVVLWDQIKSDALSRLEK